MPVYDYTCNNCGNKFEAVHSMQKTGQPGCPSCNSDAVYKLITAPGLIKTGALHSSGYTCCGREERCEKPACSTDGKCCRDKE